MAGIENLKNRILEDDKARALEIENESKAKTLQIIEAAGEKAKKILEDIKDKAEKDGIDKKDRLIARAQMEARNDILSAKQKAIDSVLKEALDYIISMPDSEYSNFIEKLIINNAETGTEEVIFSKRDKERIKGEVIDKANAALKAMGRVGSLKLSDNTANIPAGFILKRGGLEINCSVEAQIRIIRDSLEGEIANLLFEGR